MQQYREGQRLEGSDGNIYVVVNGVPTLPAQPMQSLNSIVAPSAAKVAAEQRDNTREDRRDDRADRAEARADANAARAAANEERRIRLAEETAARAAAKGDPKDVKANATAKLTAAKNLRRQLGEMREIYDRSFKGVGPLQSAREMMPTDDANRFNALARTMRADLKPLIRGPGEGTFTEGDQKLLDELIPNPRDWDGTSETLFNEIENRINTTFEQFGGEQDKATAAPLGAQISEQLEANQTAQDVAARGSQFEPTTGQTGRVADPRMASRIDSLINAGASKATIDSVLANHNKQHGTNYPPIGAAQLNAAKKYIKDTGKQFFGSEVIDRKPLNFLQRLAGSAPAAAVAHGANAATAGLVGLAAGEKGRGALDAMAVANPDEALGGNIFGGVAGAGAMGLGAANLAARVGTGALRVAPVASDMTYGALMGFNQAEEGQGGMGALTGAGAGLLGSLGGQAIARTAGAAASGVRDPAVQFLRQRGVPLTVGQAVGNSGRVGASVQNVENALTSVPGINGLVNARYREGLEGFNEAGFREMPGHTGATGAEGIAEGGQLVDDSYRFLDNAAMPYDAPFAGGQAAVRAELPNLPAYGREVGSGLDAIDTSAGRMGGVLPGREWQSAVRNTRADRASIAGQPFSRPAMETLNDVEANLMGLAQRQGPPETMGQLDAANALNGQYQTLLRALDNGPAQQADELFTPARLDAASRQGANAYGGRAASIAGDRPFYDLTTAGRSVLPSTVPDSGTATRGLVAGGLLSAGGLAGGSALDAGGIMENGGGYGLGTALLLAAGGSRQGQRILTSALLDRPDLAVNLGQALSRNARYGGILGAAATTPLAIGPNN